MLTLGTVAHPSINERLLAFYLSVIANVDMNAGVQISDRVPDFNFGGYIPKSAIPESNSMFNFLRTWHTTFHNGHTILHSLHQDIAVSISLHPFHIYFLPLKTFIKPS